MNTVTFKTAQRVSVLEDGDLIEMHIKGEGSEQVLLRFSPETLSELLRAGTNHLIKARSHKQAKSGRPAGVQALVAGAARATAVPGGSNVGMSFLANGLEFHFVLDPQKAGDLEAELVRAIADAADQAGQTRQ